MGRNYFVMLCGEDGRLVKLPEEEHREVYSGSQQASGDPFSRPDLHGRLLVVNGDEEGGVIYNATIVGVVMPLESPSLKSE